MHRQDKEDFQIYHQGSQETSQVKIVSQAHNLESEGTLASFEYGIQNTPPVSLAPMIIIIFRLGQDYTRYKRKSYFHNFYSL